MKKKKNNNKVTILFIIAALALIASIIIIGGLYVVSLFYVTKYMSLAPISYADLRPNQFVTNIYDYKGEPIDKLHGEENREFAPIDEVPENLKYAVISMEDRRFYEHPGIDVRSIMRAIYVNIRERAFVEGASTITQQLIKNNLLKNTNVELNRKVDEQIMAVKLESDLAQKLGTKKRAKDFILEQYLNSVNLAHGINGVKLGAKYYFGKELADLTLMECASLGAIIKNPVRYSPENSPEKNRERAELILFKMLEEEHISYYEYDNALNEQIKIVSLENLEDKGNNIHSYFVDQVINEVARDLMYERGFDKTNAYKLVYSGGLSIYTTFDGEIQNIIDAAFADDSLFPQSASWIDVEVTFYTEQGIVKKSAKAADENEADNFIASQRRYLKEAGYYIENESVQKVLQPQGAFAIIDYKTGHVPAIGAGRGEKQFNMAFNRATQAKRQPGSCFKVLAAYLPALDTGVIKADSLIDDAPFTIDGYSPQNYDFRYRGEIPVRTAIRDSINVAAVKTLVQTGYSTALDYLENLGFTTIVENRTLESGGHLTDLGPALALGGLTDGVTPLELTAAFGAIANNGEYVRPVFYTRVLDHDGAVLLENTPDPSSVMKRETAIILTDMMTDVVTKGTGTQARLIKVDVQTAGKTGTSTDDKDLTFGGFTPYYAAAVWQGYDKPEKLNYKTNYHLLLWRTIMENVHLLKGYTSGSFEIPENMSESDLGRVTQRPQAQRTPTAPRPNDSLQEQEEPSVESTEDTAEQNAEAIDKPPELPESEPEQSEPLPVQEEPAEANEIIITDPNLPSIYDINN